MVLYFASPPVCDPRTLSGNAVGFHLFLNERDSDVAIGVQWEGETWHFPAHRLVLSAMSDVFRKMFETDMLEKSKGRILITDCRPLALKNFLRYLYTGACEWTDWRSSVELLRVSHKYGVSSLVQLCESHLTTCLSLSNACSLYEVSQTYSLSQLEKGATGLILDAGYIVTATEGFLHLKPCSLEFFLKSKLLVMENECCVLTTLRAWAIHRCSRKGQPLSRSNVLSEMEPFLQHIRWCLIPDSLRTFIPDECVERHLSSFSGRRKSFQVSSSLQPHIHILKFVVELGAFHDTPDAPGLRCLRFGVDKHVFVAGFRMVGLFRTDAPHATGPSSLTLGRDDHRSYTQFNLHSLPWTKGATVDDYVWQELTAYLPFPVRLDPFGNYVISLKHNPRSKTRWPCTRLESGLIVTSLGNVNFHCCSECYGITQLFMLPAPPTRNVCNDLDSP